MSRSRMERLALGQWFALTTGLLAVVALAGIVVGLLALHRLGDARSLLIDRLDPATTAALRLDAAMADEETGVRGYLLTGREGFLDPYRSGRGEQIATQELLARAAGRVDVEQLHQDLERSNAAVAAWVGGYAEPTIDKVRRHGRAQPDDPDVLAGKARFDQVRVALDAVRLNLMEARGDARARLRAEAGHVRTVFVGFGVVLLIAVVAAIVTLRAVAILPLRTLVRQVRRVARGDFERTVGVPASREIVELGGHIDRMRRRILDEAHELQRSNAELEQFAYVASHDLQEPLRKVASFCQLLEQRYAGQLDERADQYIAFAVDGARRMQELINDLLAFSRVGRSRNALEAVDCNEVVRAARANLAALIEESGASLDVGPLPVVRGESSLLSLVFQNLIGNALKFRGEESPHVAIDARSHGDFWEFTCRDNGIGIDEEYGDRIFVIFQRLHSRAAYEGTGIGLAMCRKIVEHHGGRIWLSRDGDAPGSTFRFTLPRHSLDQEVPAA